MEVSYSAYVYVECNVKAKSITGSDDKTRVHYNFEQRTSLAFYRQKILTIP